ncbi:iron-sulfur binding hydrogenase [Oceanotoga teriensis]|uniref:iron-sulfur binding hydrogenase n=1 Tax=Oceanotoga teriensis TaxID=515440 RepID=UPI0027130B5F|nr:iron-sulfur binding hydrogenase [Oceanotoga teriensis]MDO7975520.1 iron-sulfur binding hydrogenase [Oceanotoga teriensis]
MTLQNMIEKLDLKIIYSSKTDTDIMSGHIGDLLSEVMRDAKKDCIWITHQTHQNIIAVAEVVGAKAIVLPKPGKYLEETIKKAEEMDISLLISENDAFETAGKIYNLLKNE